VDRLPHSLLSAGLKAPEPRNAIWMNIVSRKRFA